MTTSLPNESTPSSAPRRLNLDALRQRLRQPTPSVETPPPVALPPENSAVDPLVHVIGGAISEGCHVITARYQTHHRHAGLPLEELRNAHGTTLARITRDPRLADFDFRHTLFIDTETNGLAGGAGTYAFLIGVGYWDDDHFVVQQFFMRNPSEERAVLAHISVLLERFDSFVTFNGKSFDIPVLETRYILSRQPRPLRQRLHLDLLHPARRLWKWRLESCALGQLEQHILGTQRSEADVPGYLIPYLYNTYLRDGNPHPLKGIFYHNHQDLLALAALAVHVTRLVADPDHYTPPYGQDHYALACLYEECGELAAAEAAYHRALRAPLPKQMRCDCLRRFAGLLKRQQRWEEAAELWRVLVAQCELGGFEELAKWHEHVRKDYSAAERAVIAAFTASEQRRLYLTGDQRNALSHRLERIRRKQLLHTSSITP